MSRQKERDFAERGEVRLVDASGPPWIEIACELIREYGGTIADIAACSLQHQQFDRELAELPGAYAPPGGRLLVALAGGAPAGCIALRPIERLGPGVCEMKRMYVQPAYRGLGIGRLLAERLLEEARTAGYTLMKLDSDVHPRFAAAVALYRSLGFTDCENYNGDPDPHTVWMERPLED
jgi:GNAT superfamily N-acetyltransferase